MLSILLLISTVFLLGMLAILLHYLSPYCGIPLALIYVTGLVSILIFSNPLTFIVEPVQGLKFTIGADLYIPAILLAVLIFYVVDGTDAARTIIYSIVLLNGLVFLIFAVIHVYSTLPDNATAIPETLRAYFTFEPGAALVSLFTFTLDLFAVAIVYQGIRNRFAMPWVILAPGIALLAALWTDSIVFNTLLNPANNNLVEFLPGDIASKTISATVLAIPLTIYLRWIAPGFPEYADTSRRPILDILPFHFLKNRELLENLRLELRENRLNYQQLVENIQEAIWLANTDSQYAYFISPAFKTLTGLSPSDYYESPARFEAMVHPEDRDECGRLLCFAERSSDCEFRIIMGDGTIRWLRQRSFPIYDDKGHIIRRIGIIEDRSSYYEITNQETELMVEREKVILLRDLISEASHDLKNPLGSMGLKLDLIQRLDDPARQEKHLEDLKTLTFRFAGMIDNAFALSQVEGITAEKTTSYSINQLSRDVLEYNRVIANQQDITLHFESGIDSDVMLPGNRPELLRALGIVIETGLQRAGPGGVVTLSTNQNNDHVYLEVNDNGAGIPEEELPYIFRQVYRGANTADDLDTSMKLSLMKRIIEMHHGRVDVDSVEGAGTTFTIRLPRN